MFRWWLGFFKPPICLCWISPCWLIQYYLRFILMTYNKVRPTLATVISPFYKYCSSSAYRDLDYHKHLRMLNLIIQKEFFSLSANCSSKLYITVPFRKTKWILKFKPIINSRSNELKGVKNYMYRKL